MASGSQLVETVLFTNPGNLARDNADPTNWTWDDDDRQTWEKLKKQSSLQQFADKWREFEGLDQDLSETFINDIALPVTNDHSLMVRKCYLVAEKVTWERAQRQPKTGVILTGQLGIGKTVFLWYLLLRLLRKKQVVLLRASHQDILFYHDGVYGTTANTRARHLPTPSDNTFIWSLFDLHPNEELPDLTLDPRCFLVQCPSPNKALYSWRKARRPLYTVFPLWTVEELKLAARHSPDFKRFETNLEQEIPVEKWNDAEFLSTIHNPGLIKFHKELSPEVPELSLEVQPELSPKVQPESFEEVFGIVLNGLISDSFPENLAKAHDSALNLSFDDLEKAADDLNRPEPSADVSGPSHRLISINNVGTFEDYQLEIDFLSPAIAEKFYKRWLDASHVKAGSTIKRFLALPETRGLAGSLFEPFAHRIFVNADETDGTWGLKMMHSRDDSNVFTLLDPESSETISGFPKIKRKLVSFRSKDLPPLYENVYYIPTLTNHPLFDAFLLSFSPSGLTQRLWLLQMTTSKLHRGSHMGYTVINEIIAQINQQHDPRLSAKAKGKRRADEPSPVEVNFVLVRPTGEEEHRWVLPEGLEQLEDANVYVLELPLEHAIDSPTTRSMQSSKKAKLSTPGRKTKATTSGRKKKASTSGRQTMASTSGQRRSTRLNNLV